jgi:hypothetical protein
MRTSVATSVLEVTSIAAIVVGSSLVSAAAGWIIGGLLGLGLSWRLTR